MAHLLQSVVKSVVFLCDIISRRVKVARKRNLTQYTNPGDTYIYN